MLKMNDELIMDYINVNYLKPAKFHISAELNALRILFKNCKAKFAILSYLYDKTTISDVIMAELISTIKDTDSLPYEFLVKLYDKNYYQSFRSIFNNKNLNNQKFNITEDLIFSNIEHATPDLMIYYIYNSKSFDTIRYLYTINDPRVNINITRNTMIYIYSCLANKQNVPILQKYIRDNKYSDELGKCAIKYMYINCFTPIYLLLKKKCDRFMDDHEFKYYIDYILTDNMFLKSKINVKYYQFNSKHICRILKCADIKKKENVYTIYKYFGFPDIKLENLLSRYIIIDVPDDIKKKVKYNTHIVSRDERSLKLYDIICYTTC